MRSAFDESGDYIAVDARINVRELLHRRGALPCVRFGADNLDQLPDARGVAFRLAAKEAAPLAEGERGCGETKGEREGEEESGAGHGVLPDQAARTRRRQFWHRPEKGLRGEECGWDRLEEGGGSPAHPVPGTGLTPRS